MSSRKIYIKWGTLYCALVAKDGTYLATRKKDSHKFPGAIYQLTPDKEKAYWFYNDTGAFQHGDFVDSGWSEELDITTTIEIEEEIQ